ncbi:hypothetical protein [Henriciella marina]|uniref:hypothetical protein n=1 Tax=Henriciella marina TaxID=453851 RepID=UPI0003625C38|nr:hypothetical protein [Henriciella marina]
MSAERDLEHPSESDVSQSVETSRSVPQPRPQDASAGTHNSAGGSPARALQDDLETRLKQKADRHWISDMGRVLASASGITMILGIFLFGGIL